MMLTRKAKQKAKQNGHLKDLLNSTCNSTQRYVPASAGERCGREWIHVYAWLSPDDVHLKPSTLLIGYTPVQNLKKQTWHLFTCRTDSVLCQSSKRRVCVAN